jgi:hypothetical protein
VGSDPALSTLVSHERHREIPLRDVRDLALAVIEGAVAAEALAKELRRTPDRSEHFREIAERLRAVVSRESIRDALKDDRPNASLVVAPSRPAPPRPSPSPPADVEPPANPERSSGSRQLAPATVSELVEALSRALRWDELASRLARQDATANPVARLDEVASRLAGLDDIARRLEELPLLIGRLEEATNRLACTDDATSRLERIEAALGSATRRGTERVVVRTADDALAIASRLVARLRAGSAIEVEIADGDRSTPP